MRNVENTILQQGIEHRARSTIRLHAAQFLRDVSTCAAGAGVFAQPRPLRETTKALPDEISFFCLYWGGAGDASFGGGALGGVELGGGTVDGAVIAASSTSTARRNSSFEGSNFSAVSKSLLAAWDRPILPYVRPRSNKIPASVGANFDAISSLPMH